MYWELKLYVRINTEELNFLKIKIKFFLRIRNRGFMKKVLMRWFSEVKYANLNRAELLVVNLEDTSFFQGTREALVDSTLIKIGEGIIGEVLDPNTSRAAEVVSEGEDTEVSKSTNCQNGDFSKGIDNESVVCLLSLKPNKKQKSKQTLLV